MLRRFLLSLLISVLVVACNDDATSPDTGLAGTWSLQTVDGKPLPFTLPETGEIVTAESMTLNASGRFTMVTVFRVTNGGSVSSESIPDSGTYVANGSKVTFTYDSDGSTDIATVSDNTFSLGDIDHIWVYRRN